jgi:protein-tyrosine phosphatase
MFERILVVCIGNICRSPVAEAMLTQALPGRRIESAGLGALVGQGADPTAQQIAAEDGLDLSQHQARQISLDMLQAADLVLVMSEGQRRAVGEQLPAALGKTMLIGRWLADGSGREIPDPYRKSHEAFEHVHQLLKDATAAWVSKL